MAEFAVGLTKTAVEGTLSLVKSAVEEEKKLREKVQNDLVFISGELEMMQSFLRVANNKNDDQVLLTSVRQLRTLAFDVEDCVENVVHLDLDNSSHWAWLRRVWHTVNCRAPSLPLDDAVAEIRQLKARVEDVSQRNMRYNNLILIHGSSSNNNSNNKQQPAVSAIMPYAEQASTYHPSSAALRDVWVATGKWGSKICDLQQELLLIAHDHDHDLQVISVWGSTSGGRGPGTASASIFRKAYRDPKISESFKIRVWVKLTHPFNHYEFVKSLLAQFSVSSSSHQQANTGVDFSWTSTMTAADQVMTEAYLMKDKLMEQRYLVVLEGSFTLEEWDVIRMYLPNSKKGSRILLSTPQLGIGLLCTGEPYQVSELENFSGDNQFLCAFSKKQKMTPSGVVKFYRQLLRCHGVISVWGPDDDDKSNLVDVSYKGVINGWSEEVEVVADKSDHVDMLYKDIRNRMRRSKRKSSWVDVPDPFDLKVFAQRLFLNFHSDDIDAEEISEVGTKGEKGLFQWCRKFLSEAKVNNPYVVVINGLRSKGDWDLIQSTFFSSKEATRAKAGCILVITKEESVATHCVKDHTHLVFNAKDLKADPSISALIEKGCWQYAIRGKKGRLLYDRRKDAREWVNKFKDVGGNNLYADEGKDEEGLRVFTTSCAQDMEYSEKGVLRHVYYGALFEQQVERRCSWVDLSFFLGGDDRADLTPFSWHLLLDFYSDDPHQAKETIAVGLMEGTIDPIQKCLDILRNEKCLVVISGLRSKTFWDLIKSTFFSDSEHIHSTIVVVGLARMKTSDVYDFENDTTNKVQQLAGTQQQGCLIDMRYKADVIRWVQPVGRDREVVHISFLVQLHMSLVVWGIPGVGISTVVRTAYYQEIRRSSGIHLPPGVDPNDPTEAFAWVDVPCPFNLTEFAWHLFLDFYSDDPQAKETAIVSMMKEGRQVPILECRKILHTGRCMVVMDGLRSKQDWDLIKTTFLAEPIEGSIVVITIEEVAMHCVQNNKERAINITRLEASVALRLLRKIASKDGTVTSEWTMEQSKSIVGKCGGLAKVIAAIGAELPWVTRALRGNFMGTLETNPSFHSLRPLFSWMKSYFDACSDSLKPCIFYLSIFSPTERKNIRRQRLLWRWIAEGYCRDTSDGSTCEKNGEKFISELVKLSIIQESASSKVFCEINGFFHEYIVSRPMEDNLVFALEEGCILNSTRAGQHLTIRSSWDRRDIIVFESIDFSRLRSLTVFGKWKSFFVCSDKVKMGLLRVLDLEDAEGVTNEDLEQIAKRLTRLKFLSLRGCREITRLPTSMACLRQLQTLDIRHTSVVTLPIFITKLQKLRYIRAGTTTQVWDWEGDIIVAGDVEEDRATDGATPTEAEAAAGSLVSCDNRPRPRTLVSSFLSKLCRRSRGGPATGVTVPADIGKLAIIHTLGVVNVNAQCSSKDDMGILEELKKLRQLRKLGVSGINQGNIKHLCSALSSHAHLRSLSVELGKDDDGLDDIPRPPETISSLKLYGRGHKLLPVWMEHRYGLQKLHLSIEKPEDLPELSFKLFTDHLRIRPIQDGELRIGPCWMHNRVFEIQCSSELQIKFDDPNNDGYAFFTEVIKVHFSEGSGSQQSSLQISGLSNLTYLKEVWLKGYADAHKQYMQRQISEMRLRHQHLHQERPVLKLVQPRSS